MTAGGTAPKGSRTAPRRRTPLAAMRGTTARPRPSVAVAGGGERAHATMANAECEFPVGGQRKAPRREPGVATSGAIMPGTAVRRGSRRSGGAGGTSKNVARPTRAGKGRAAPQRADAAAQKPVQPEGFRAPNATRHCATPVPGDPSASPGRSADPRRRGGALPPAALRILPSPAVALPQRRVPAMAPSTALTTPSSRSANPPPLRTNTPEMGHGLLPTGTKLGAKAALLCRGEEARWGGTTFRAVPPAAGLCIPRFLSSTSPLPCPPGMQARRIRRMAPWPSSPLRHYWRGPNPSH